MKEKSFKSCKKWRISLRRVKKSLKLIEMICLILMGWMINQVKINIFYIKFLIFFLL